jgi:hypothetical protein
VALSRQAKVVKIARDGTLTDYAKGIGAGASEPIGQLQLDKAGNLYAAAGPASGRWGRVAARSAS